MKENRKLLKEVLKDIRHDMTDEEVLNLLADSKISVSPESGKEKYTLGQRAADAIAKFAGRQQLFVQQLFRNFTRDNFLSQSLGNGGFADTGFADETRVILTATRQNLNYSLDLFITTNDRIQFSCSGVSRQIVGELR